MFLNLFFGSPAIALTWIVAILLSLTVHEFSHALVGKLRGDKTAEREGRLTLNPISHIDLTGFILLLLFGFGWAKPVPYNPYNLKDPKWDSVRIALAGPLSNLIMAVIAGTAFRVLVVGGVIAPLNLLSVFLFLTIVLNLFLLLFNIIPVHPLDGSKLFFALFDAPNYQQLRNFVATKGPRILMIGVLLSAFTSINIFFFISGPAFAICDALTGQSCGLYFSAIFSAM
ncbi:site-2 protease family protein [Candidatus Uhrbacteria bacterium]|jgi:Zn-dependent protease|nr:site-2 protease family protein [Candidatus Uhrbacteria bacterium]